mgnify:CR=1 FL=1
MKKNEGMHEYMLENKLKPVVNKDSVLPELKKDSEALLRKITSGKRTLHAKHNILSQEKGLLNLLGGVSFIMLLVCFVMGAGLIQSDERISAMEQQIAQLQETLDGTQSVFASQTQQTTVQAVKITKNNCRKHNCSNYSSDYTSPNKRLLSQKLKDILNM